MMSIKGVSLIIMALLYLGAGINHFRVPRFYERIIPSYFKNKKFINEASGVAEIILGIGWLIPATSTLAAWAVIVMLISFFPAHFYHLQQNRAGMKVPVSRAIVKNFISICIYCLSILAYLLVVNH